ncbi:MAG: hypothetical protein K940chlam3_00145 [Chlamydiae bacterium]|nr:hypothetical protein [Chlamydiota bacterium]
MLKSPELPKKSVIFSILLYFWMGLGAFLAAFAIEVFFIPNNLIDGGVVGVAMIFGKIFGKSVIPWLLIIFNLPFLYLAFRSIGKTFLLHMFVALLMFSGFMIFIANVLHLEFKGDPLEVVVIGGAILGIGLGLIIRSGGCLDGTEILGIILNRRTGFTVGQVVLFVNVFVFGAAGFVFQDWHPPLLSFITYMVAIKVMDAVIVGLEETKACLIISQHSKKIAERVIHELGLGLTIMYGRGGYSGEDQEILYVIVERLQLHDLKELIFTEDPKAFIAIENLHEVANGMQGTTGKRSRVEQIVKRILTKPNNLHA